MIDDNVKQKLLDLLAEEPTMVLSTAYAYAKNYVEYGEDITKAWTTAVQQASILEQIKIKVKTEAYDSFKKEYENCLKADMVAMLEEIVLGIDEMYIPQMNPDYMSGYFDVKEQIKDDIQQKIEKLKETK